MRGIQRDAYKSAVSEQLDIVLLTDICHAVERPGVNQGELYDNERMSIRSFFLLCPAIGDVAKDGILGADMDTYLNLI